MFCLSHRCSLPLPPLNKNALIVEIHSHNEWKRVDAMEKLLKAPLFRSNRLLYLNFSKNQRILVWWHPSIVCKICFLVPIRFDPLSVHTSLVFQDAFWLTDSFMLKLKLLYPLISPPFVRTANKSRLQDCMRNRQQRFSAPCYYFFQIPSCWHGIGVRNSENPFQFPRCVS